MAVPDCFKEDKRVLEKYKNGAIVDKEDRPTIERLQMVGLMKEYGLSLSKMKETTKTTPLGLKLFKIKL
jgi:hypothetical protein